MTAGVLPHGPEDDLADARAQDPVDRLLEDSWEERSRRASAREMVSEAIAAIAFLAVAIPLAVQATASHDLDLRLALLLVGLYALVGGTIRFPVGVGYVVPTWVILVPMLLLLPPGVVPLLTAAGMAVASLGRWALRRGSVDRVLFAIPNAWHAVGPAVVLLLFGRGSGAFAAGAVYTGAFLAGCAVDLVASTLREAGAMGIAPTLQVRVITLVWMIDACIAPLGLLLAEGARHDHSKLLMVLPLAALLLVLERDRSARIDQAQDRLKLVGRERTRLQAAVRRLGDAFAAKLDLTALTTIAMQGSIDAVDADGGMFTLSIPGRSPLVRSAGPEEPGTLLIDAADQAQRSLEPTHLERDGVRVLALPLDPTPEASGAVVVWREGREFRRDEQELLGRLAERAQVAIADVLGHEVLLEQAMTDPLTGLGNRRKLASDMTTRQATVGDMLVLMLFDLDGFKTYNDTFGHLAGDALLSRLGKKLAAAVADHGTAYRLGGDEFCVLLSAEPYELHHQLARADGAMHERGADYSVRASCGTVLLPHEASTPEQAMQLADQRMYAHKQRRPSGTRAQTRNVLLRIMGERDGGLSEHSIGVAALALAVARRLGMTANDLDELLRAAELHDIGKVAIPDSILEKPEALTPEEWRCMRQHTILGERILSAAPALRPVAAIVRATHERWDGRGYPDRLAGEQIPLAARIIAACDAYDAMTADRCYRPANDIGFAREELLREAGRQFDPVVVAAILDELDLAAPDGVADPLAEAAVGRRGTDEIADRLLEIIAGSAERSGPHEVKPQRRERRAPGFPQVLAAPTVEGTESHQREQR